MRIADAEIAGRAHGAAQRFDAAPMALDARQAARRRPASVAVHDDGDMARHVELVADCGMKLCGLAPLGHRIVPATLRPS